MSANRKPARADAAAGRAPRPGLPRACLGEFLGTFLMVFIGISTVALAVIMGMPLGPLGVAGLWGMGVALAITATARMSGAHLNPAITLALALFWPGLFPRGRVAAYWAAQLAGAAAAGIAMYALFHGAIGDFESRQGIVRGLAGSERSAMIFGEYFPNPALYAVGAQAPFTVAHWQAALVEGFGTAILAAVVFALTDPAAKPILPRRWVPAAVGLTVAVLIAVFAPLTQAGWNPARDFGPRLVAYAAGWGPIALPGPHGGFWVYVAGPLAGGTAGAAAYEIFGRPLRRKRKE